MLPTWLDVMFSEDWQSAFMRTAAATAEAYPDFGLESYFCERMISLAGGQRRRTTRHYARRLHGDPHELDLCWLMLSATPEQPWTFGFVHRLASVATAWTEIDPVGVDRGWPDASVVSRLERWESIRDGAYAAGDIFVATTDDKWREAENVRKIARAAAEAEQGKAEKLTAKTPPEPVPEASNVPSLLIIADAADKVHEPYKRLQKPVELTMTPDVMPVRDLLLAEFPHAATAIETMMVDLREHEPLKFRPFILIGEPGCGKSRLVRRLAEHLGARLRRYDGASSSDNAFGGTPKRWSTSSACFPLIVVATCRVGNPLIMIDEIDKAGGNGWNGSLANALMPFLERETAAAYPDIGLDLQVDLSGVCYALTANDETRLPSPLRDRCRIIRVPSPTVEHLEMLTASIMRDIVADRNIAPAWLAPLAQDELAVIAKAWSGSDRSVRKLQKIVAATVTARETTAVRH